MKTLILCFSFFGLFSINDISTSRDGVDTIVIVCGTDRDGNYHCIHVNYDDGSDCIVVDNEGAPSGVQFFC